MLEHWNMINAHHFEHANTFIVVLTLVMLISGFIYGWRTAYKVEGIKKVNTTKLMKLRNGANCWSKVMFCIILSAGVSWVIDYVI